MTKSSSLFRVFKFVCDGLPYSIAVDHCPAIAGPEQESYLTDQFYSLLEAVLPGRRAAGQVTGINSFDDTHPEPSSDSAEPARLSSRRARQSRAPDEWLEAVCH